MSRHGGTAGSWSVVGGGMLGLTLAWRLAQRGRAVTLIEAAPSLGGLTASFTHGDVSWDRFYHVIDAGDHHLLNLLDEIGLKQAVVWCTTNTNFFDGHKQYPLNNAADYIRLPALGFVDKMRIGMNIVYGSALHSGRKLEKMSAEEWLCRWSGSRGFERLWRPLLKSKLGDNYARVSAAYIWSVMRRFYGARHGGSKTEKFGYVPGGYAQIIETLTQALYRHGVDIRIGTPVSTVSSGKHDRIEVATANGSIESENAVITLPSPLITNVCPALDTAELRQHEQISYQGVVCLSMLLRRPLGGAYMTYITDDTVPFTTVIEMTALAPTLEYGGHHLAYLPKYVPSDDPQFEQHPDEILASFTSGLARMYPDFTMHDIVAHRIARARHVLALPTLNYSQMLPPISTTVPGLYICNSAQIINASLSVNETVALANQTATSLLKP